MSAVLVITKDKKQIAKVALPQGLFVIGRHANCDLPIDEDLASREHAEISGQGQRYTIRDLKSTNGTKVGGQKLTRPRELRDGDEIEICSTRLKFLCEEAAADDEGETRPAKEDDWSKQAPGQAVVEKKNRGKFDVKLRVMDGPQSGAVFKNWEGPLTIGRNKENHVVLEDNAVTSCHAQIVQEGDHYFIIDTNSSNGTFLNGVKVQRAELADGNKIKVGPTTLIFDLTDLVAQRRNLNIALACVILCAVVVVVKKLIPDRPGDYIKDALRLEANGDFSHALDAFQQARTLAPNRAEAIQGYSRVQSEIMAADTLKKAEEAAEAEHYDEALELVFQVQNTFKDSTRAAELEAVIKLIKEAKVALDNQNWDVAVKRLGKARETYPNSKLINLQLGQAQKELADQGNLSQAKDAFKYEQWEKARQFLTMIPTNSFYAYEARQYSDKITKQEKTAASFNNAKSNYNRGFLMPALTEIENGLKIAPDSPALADLQKRVRAMIPLTEPLKKAEKLGQEDAIDDLLAARKACADVLLAESDPLNETVKSAKEVDARIAQWLQTMSQSLTEKARNSLRSGSRKEAVDLFLQASKADPANQQAAQEGKKLRDDISKKSEALFGEARGYDSVGLKDEARDRLNLILKTDLPDDRWYQEASKMLDRLK